MEVVMFTVVENLDPGVSPEAFLRSFLTLDRRHVPLVEVVRRDESPRQDVAYILRTRPREAGEVGGPEMLVAFLKDYAPNRLECQVYREGELPYAFDCPRALLEQLGPTNDPPALQWRAQCWQRLLHPLCEGDVIAFLTVLPGGMVPAGTPLCVEFVREGFPVFVEIDGRERYTMPLWPMLPYAYLGESQNAHGVVPARGLASEERIGA
jgi:hypothetical protein